MNKILLAFLCLTFSSIYSQSNIEINRCYYDEYHLEKALSSSTWEQRKLIFENKLQAELQRNTIATPRQTITIPVVFHIIWNENSQNLSDLQILSQLDILNEDFRLRNKNMRNIPTEFEPLAADTHIEFCLATRDPEGNITPGITRTQTEYECIGDFLFETQGNTSRLFYDELGGKTAWNPEDYLNIWVAPTCGSFIGFGFSPDMVENRFEDGLVIDSGYLGNVCNDGSNRHLGRTATHEMGHFFYLRHIWGEVGCEVDDGVEDTPRQDNFHRSCPSTALFSCGSSDMYMNFMDYTDDACISMFTEGQKDRMHAALMAFRPGLATSTKCSYIIDPEPDLNVLITPNPSKNCINIYYNANFDGNIDVSLFDVQGKLYFLDENNASNVRSIDVSHLPVGIYYLNLDNGSTSVVRSILVAR